MTTSSDYTLRRARLVAEFCDSLPEKANDLAERWEAYCAAAGGSTTLKEVEILVHRLAGSCGMFGHERASSRARRALTSLGELRATSDPARLRLAGLAVRALLKELRRQAVQ